MNALLSVGALARENSQFHGTSGVSAGGRSLGFIPAFRDSVSGRAYPSRFADGRPAPIHLLDGLPETLVIERRPDGTVTAVKQTVVSGFLRDGQFYTRDQAATLA